MRVRGWWLVLVMGAAACDDDPVRAPVPAALAVQGGGQSAGAGTALPSPLVARVTDEDGDPVRGVTVRWTVSAGDVEPDSAVTDSLGEARTVWTVGGTPGTQTATASVEGLQPASVTATVGAGPAARVAALPDSLVFSLDGDTAGVRVEAADRFGNAVDRSAVSLVSLDPGVAAVDPAGVVRAVADGTTRIVVSSGAAADTVAVRVRIARYVSVSAGINHTCAVTAAGEAFCWGAGAFGVLGNGTTGDRYFPTRVAGATRWASVSAGFQHTCGLSTDGVALCWGYNDAGQLGIGVTGGSRNEPVPVQTDERFTRVTVGGKHGCGLSTTGRVLCWGSNGSGQLGAGNFPAVYSTPIEPRGARTFTDVSAGSEHTCGISGGIAFCWGGNDSGQLGIGGRSLNPNPTAVRGGRVFASISAGSAHTCALEPSGAAFCWGSNSNGELGTGAASGLDVPGAVAGSRAFRSVDAGSDHTCAVDRDGTALCWGRGAEGQLGNGSTESVRAPTPVSDAPAYLVAAAGGRHSCGVLASGVAKCWGTNGSGQLGTGTDARSAVPVRVAAPR